MLNAYSRRKDGNALLSRSFRVRECLQGRHKDRHQCGQGRSGAERERENRGLTP